MENFRPPAMDEVTKEQKKQKKQKHIIFFIVFACLILFGFGGFFAIRQFAVYLNYTSTQARYKMLNTYLHALAANNNEVAIQLAPNNTNYILPISGTEYNLHIFPDATETDESLIFVIVDSSRSPQISYLQKVTYGTLDNNVIIDTITPIGTGNQIN